MKPKMFIGSSVEGLPVANAIQDNLDYDADITVWNQGIFELSANTLLELERIAKNCHFAVFVFTPDDIIFSRKKQAATARDNVVFETGLFFGALGSSKVYMLKPRNVDLKLPSDLLGITMGSYNAERPEVSAAVGAFCTNVRNMIHKYYGEGLSPLSNANLIENFIHYDIKILNSDGDTNLTLTHSITPVRQPMTSRKHEIFSDAGAMDSTELNLTAWDGRKNELLVKIERDYPARKHFKIHFKDCLALNETLEYAFSFHWKGMFPSREEYFKLKKIDGKSSFCLHYPKSWSMMYVKAEYDSESDNLKPIALKKKKTKVHGDLKTEEYDLGETDINSSIILSWNRK